jgi:hypothetical protein
MIGSTFQINPETRRLAICGETISVLASTSLHFMRQRPGHYYLLES